jgi:F0F1-type ATP synthase assembly protein I
MQSGKKSPKKRGNDYLRYSGLGLQLLLTIGVAGWVGYKLDQYLSLKFPVFLLCFVLLGFVGALYKIYRALGGEE